MGTIRYFSGARSGGKMGAAGEIMRFEIMKKGKMPSGMRYKQIMKKRLEESRQKAISKIGLPKGFKLPGSIIEARQMSKRAEHALKEIAQKKARKEAKALRQMVIVQPRVFPNGRLTQKGQIYDVAGNLVAKVNTKNGNMTSLAGWSFGKYKPKSVFTDMAIQGAINQWSPYFINQRRLQMLQQQGVQQYGVHGPASTEFVTAHGPAASPPNVMQSFYGNDHGGGRQNVSATVWGTASNNVWGTFGDNVHGTFADNVWGGNYSDVWGGISAPSMWGQKGPNIWGTGNGKNYLRGLTNAVAAFFGLSTKKNRERLSALSSAARRSSAPASVARSAPAPNAPRR